MILTNNIDLVRISLQGKPVVYFPYNTNFKNRKVNRILFANAPTLDPITLVEVQQDLSDIYITVKSTDESFILRDVDITTMLGGSDCDLIEINDFINYDTSNIKIKNYSGTTDKVLLMYVFYEETFVEDIRQTNSIRVLIPSGEHFLNTYIDSPDYGKLVRLEMESDTPDSFISIYDKHGRTFSLLPKQLFSKGATTDPQINNPIHFNYFDVDYQRSKVISSGDVYLTLYFNKK